mmetsp:Transcript_4693/g.10127  ORF Transcript_4693/g.10127 Transcript_4693/m.10127 type:complete len:355 (+) Transcript_4693:39-1103(+)
MGWLAQLLQLTHGQEAHPTSLVEESNRESLPEVLDPHFRQQVEDFYRHTINDIHSDMQMLKAYASAADASEKASFLEVKSASLDPRVCFLPSGRPSSYLLTKKLGRGHHKRTMFDELESEDQEAEQAEEDGKAEGEGKEKEEWTPAKSFNKASKEMGGGGIKKDAMFPNMRNMLSEDGDEKYEMKEKDLMAGGGNQKDGMLGKGVGKGGQEDVMLGKGLGKGYQKDALRSADEQETEEEGPHLFYSGGDKKDMQLDNFLRQDAAESETEAADLFEDAVKHERHAAKMAKKGANNVVRGDYEQMLEDQDEMERLMTRAAEDMEDDSMLVLQHDRNGTDIDGLPYKDDVGHASYSM